MGSGTATQATKVKDRRRAAKRIQAMKRGQNARRIREERKRAAIAIQSRRRSMMAKKRADDERMRQARLARQKAEEEALEALNSKVKPPKIVPRQRLRPLLAARTHFARPLTPRVFVPNAVVLDKQWTSSVTSLIGSHTGVVRAQTSAFATGRFNPYAANSPARQPTLEDEFKQLLKSSRPLTPWSAAATARAGTLTWSATPWSATTPWSARAATPRSPRHFREPFPMAEPGVRSPQVLVLPDPHPRTPSLRHM